MTVIDKILNEWSYRCSDGIVDMNNPTKRAILNAILEENGVELDEKTTSRSAKYFSQQDQSQEEPTAKPVNNTFMNDVDSFSQFVLDKYAAAGQTISGLDTLYMAIQKSSNKDNLFKIIQLSGNKKLNSGKSSIQNIESELFNMILSSVRIQNGDPSELWFAIMYNGEAKGGVASETGIESDVDVDGKGVSIKNYKSIGSLDFGSLPSDLLKDFKKIINLLSILTGEEVTASLTIPSINKLLVKLGSPEIQQDLKELLSIGRDTNINALKNIYNSVSKIIPDGNVEKLVDNFVDKVNNLVLSKIKSVEWWAVIAGKSELYLEPSSVIASRLHSKEGQLSSVINQIKGNNLFVKGNVLFTGTEEK
jgi:hypothetical protein